MATPRRRSRTALGVAGILALVAAAVGVVLNLRTPRGTAVDLPIIVNRPAPIDAANSPALARSPVRPGSLAITYRIDRPDFSASLQSTSDAGGSWRPAALPLPEGRTRPFAPDVAFGPDGTLYVLYSNLSGRANRPESLWLSRSGDGGRTLSEPVRVAGPLTFQARIAVDPKGPVHITWLQAEDTGTLRFAGDDPYVVAVTSTDGGRTFSGPVRVSDPERARVGAATPVVDGTGRIVVLYEDFKADRRDFEYLEGPPYEGTFALVLTSSLDGGQTFSRGLEFESGIVPTRRFLAFLPDFPSLAAGSGSRLYAAWSDGRLGSDDVFLRASDDGGKTWSGPVRVNDNDRADGTSQTLPRVGVAPGGRVDVLYYDRRRDRGRNALSDVTLASSNDEGRTWENVRVTARRFDTRIGPSADLLFGVDFGTRLGLASASSHSYAAWTDSRFGTEVTGRQDIAFTAVRHPGTVPLAGRWPVVAGLVVLGGVAVVAARAPEPVAVQPGNEGGVA